MQQEAEPGKVKKGGQDVPIQCWSGEWPCQNSTAMRLNAEF